MVVVGLVGRARVGKDTIARHLVETQEYTLHRLARPIKEACMALYGWSPETLESAAKDVVDPVWGLTPRDAMVHLTHTLQDKMGPLFFARRLFESLPSGARVVIPDVRYKHDIDEIHRRGGVTIKITRQGVPHFEHENHIDALETTYTYENISLDVLNAFETSLHSNTVSIATGTTSSSSAFSFSIPERSSLGEEQLRACGHDGKPPTRTARPDASTDTASANV